MKRILLLILVIGVLFSSACGVTEEPASTTETTEPAPTTIESSSQAEDAKTVEDIGQWIDEAWPGGAIMTMTRENGSIILEIEFNDDSRNREEMVEETVAGEQRFEEKLGSVLGEYYVITATGDLDMYDEIGYIRTAAKIKD